jgi:DNA-binding MarR family transcriptional regulator
MSIYERSWSNMEYAIHTLLVRTAHAQQNYLRPYLKKLGLSPGQPKVLRCLTALGPCSQKALADYCEVDPAAICRMLDSLERDGFLLRQPSKTDRRSGEVVLTDKGREAFIRWEDQCMALQDTMLQGFSPEERQQLAGYLARAYRNVGGRLLSGEEEPSCRT